MSKYERALENLNKLLKAMNEEDNNFKYHYYFMANDMVALSELVEKEKPKKANHIKREYSLNTKTYYLSGVCECGNLVLNHKNYCDNCGQHLDWSE